MIRKYFTITYDILPTEIRTTEAVTFNSPSSFVDVYSLPDHTGFTAHTQMLFFQSPHLNISSALFRAVFGATSGGPAEVKFRAFHYEPALVWEDLGIVIQNQTFNPDNQGLNVTNNLNAKRTAAQYWYGFTAQVKGIGKLYEARLEVVYEVPDYADDIASLSTRVAALEAMPPGSFTGPLTAQQVQQVLDVGAAKLTA